MSSLGELNDAMRQGMEVAHEGELTLKENNKIRRGRATSYYVRGVIDYFYRTWVNVELKG